MKKRINILYILLFLSTLFSSSMIKSTIFPGWGELNEYNLLLEDDNKSKFQYIKDRSNKFMIAEGIVWLGLFLSNDFRINYKDDYQNYGSLYAGVNWSGKSDLFAAHVGNYDSVSEYNDIVRLISGPYADTYDEENPSYHWDWQNNNSLRHEYDNIRNRSEQFDEFKTLMIAALAINRIISVFDVMSINRKHVKSVSVNSYDENNEVGIKFNYNF